MGFSNWQKYVSKIFAKKVWQKISLQQEYFFKIKKFDNANYLPDKKLWKIDFKNPLDMEHKKTAIILCGGTGSR